MHGKIFLLGFMGVGKTTIGKRLAKKLSTKFIDTDQLIEAKFGCSVSEFFEKFGESTFRKEEHSVLKDIIAQRKQAVISVGGGLPCFHNNMELMNQNGITVYLQRPPKELFQRLQQGKHKRPLLADKTDSELLDFIQKSLTEREAYYNRAHIIASREQQEPKDLIELIIKVSDQ